MIFRVFGRRLRPWALDSMGGLLLIILAGAACDSSPQTTLATPHAPAHANEDATHRETRRLQGLYGWAKGFSNCSVDTDCLTGFSCLGQVCTCLQTSCAAVGKSCGTIPNKCGKSPTVFCGTCTKSHHVCIKNNCVCVPDTCARCAVPTSLRQYKRVLEYLSRYGIR